MIAHMVSSVSKVSLCLPFLDALDAFCSMTTASLHYSEAIPTRDGLCWKIYFVIIKDSELYNQVHSSHYVKVSTIYKICSSLQLIKDYFCEKDIVIQSSESLSCPIEFAEDRVTLDFPNGEFVSGN